MTYNITSSTVISGTVASQVKEWKFILETGNVGVKIVSDPLLDTEELAGQRARSEFLSNGYRRKEIQFQVHRTDFDINETINIEGLPYLVKGINTKIDSTKMVTTIKGVRYE